MSDIKKERRKLQEQIEESIKSERENQKKILSETKDLNDKYSQLLNKYNSLKSEISDMETARNLIHQEVHAYEKKILDMMSRENSIQKELERKSSEYDNKLAILNEEKNKFNMDMAERQAKAQDIINTSIDRMKSLADLKAQLDIQKDVIHKDSVRLANDKKEFNDYMLACEDKINVFKEYEREYIKKRNKLIDIKKKNEAKELELKNKEETINRKIGIVNTAQSELEEKGIELNLRELSLNKREEKIEKLILIHKLNG